MNDTYDVEESTGMAHTSENSVVSIERKEDECSFNSNDLY